MDCILFKWKLCLFLDFLKYICVCVCVCVLSGMEGQNDKVIKNFQII